MTINLSDLQAVFDRLEKGEDLSERDSQLLVTAARAKQITIAAGEGAVAIGGSADGAVVIIVNGNLVITGANAVAIRDLLGATGSPPPQAGVSSDRISQQSAAISDSNSDRSQPINMNKRQRLKKQSQTLQSEWNTRIHKLERLRVAFAIECDIAIQFKLESYIKAEETAIAALERQLSELERQLSEIEDTLNAGGQSKPEKKSAIRLFLN